MKDLIIESGDGAYSVCFYNNVASVLEKLSINPKYGFVVDRKVLHLYPQIQTFLVGKNHLVLDATEETKTWNGAEHVLTWFQNNKFTKENTVVAIGGGIIQDTVCFSASVYYRGLHWSFVPTTLLSMADSCIGAKCGLNFNQFKNQIGTFHSPKAVLLATDFVQTLTDNDVLSGYGEILKLMITGGADKYALLKHALVEKNYRGPMLSQLLYESLLVKKNVIEKDEYEKDLRRILNYGHTFGHALESITNHEVPHGQAVAWGIDLINFISWKKNLLSEQTYFDIHHFIVQHFKFALTSSVTAGALIEGARRDKKAAAGSVNLVLLTGLGKLEVCKVDFDDQLQEWILGYLRS